MASNPHFRVARVAPESPGGVWTYASLGGWAATAGADHGHEFVISVGEPSERAVELLAMTVHYNRTGRLGWAHTLPIGDRHVEFLWLLPITEAERDFKVDQGLEALEQRFDDVELAYSRVDRASAV